MDRYELRLRSQDERVEMSRREPGADRDDNERGTPLLAASATARVVVLVGDAAHDQPRVATLLSDNIVVILIPSLESEPSPSEGGVPASQSPSRAIITFEELEVDLTKHRVRWGTRDLQLTERELGLLVTLSTDPGRAPSFA